MVTGTTKTGPMHSTLENSSVGDTTLGELVLKIQGTSRNGQVLRLKSAKCTIGSGPNCTLRLHGRGVDPVHCIIMRGQNGAVIRRWSPDTRLNGRAFTDARISAGDRLNIGSLEFEIVETGEGESQASSATVCFTKQDSKTPAPTWPQKDYTLEAEQLEARQRQLRQEEVVLNLRARQLDDDAAALQTEQNKFETERRRWDDVRNTKASAEQQQLDIGKKEIGREKEALILQAKQLAAATAELQAERAKFEDEQRQWEANCSAAISKESNLQTKTMQDQLSRLEAERTELETQRQSFILEQQQRQSELETSNQALRELEQQLNKRSVILDALAGELETRESELNSEKSALETKKNELDSRLAQIDSRAAELETQTADTNKRSAEIQSQLSELQNSIAEFEAKQAEFEDRCSRREETCIDRETALNLREEELNQQAAQLENMQTQLDADREQFETAQKSVAAESSRVKTESDIDDQEKQQQREEDYSPGSPVSTYTSEPEQEEEEAQTAGYQASEQSASNDEDESIDKYMSRLMQRIRSTQGDMSESVAVQNDPAPSPAESATLPKEGITLPPIDTTPEPVKFTDTSEMSPRTLAPEKQVNITLFRDLANYSAQNALGTHARRQTIHAMYSKLIVSLLGGAVGIVLLCIWRMWFTSNITLYAAMLGFLVAIIWGVQYVRLTVRLLASGSVTATLSHAKQPSDEAMDSSSVQTILSEFAGKEFPTEGIASVEDVKALHSAKHGDDSENYRYYKNI